MENTDTQEQVENTTQVEENTTETNDTNVDENSVSTSGEENNAQAEDESSSNDVGAKSVRELASERSKVPTMWEREREKVLELEQNIQAQSYQPVQSNVNQLQNFGMTALELKIARMEEERGWEKAYAKYPELRDDPQLDEMVYANYVARKNAGENVSPEKVAGDYVSYLEKKIEKVKSKTYEQAENDISQKSLLSTKSARRSSNRGGETNINDLKDRARKGDRDALDRLYDYI